MKAKSWTMLLPVGMCFIPGLLVSQDAKGRVPPYQKEMGPIDGEGTGADGLSKVASTKATGKPFQEVGPASQALVKADGKPAQQTSTSAAKANENAPNKELLKERLDRLHQQYQEELQALLGSAQEANRAILPVSDRRFSEPQGGSYGAPRQLDPGFQSQEWPTLPRAGDPTPWESRKAPASGSAKPYPNDRGIVTASSPAQGGQYADEGDGYRADDAILQVQGRYPAQGNNPNQAQPQRQTIRSTAPATNYSDPSQAQQAYSRRGNAPVQPLGAAQARQRPVTTTVATENDNHIKDIEILKARYLADLRALNRRYQDEAAQMLNGAVPSTAQPVHHQTEVSAGAATNQRSAPYAAGNVQRSGRYFDFFWLPRMFGYFKPTLPFARMNQDTVVVDQGNGATRTTVQTHQPVKQTGLFTGLSQPEQKKTITSRSQGRPIQQTSSGAPATSAPGYSRGDAVQPAVGDSSYENGPGSGSGQRGANGTRQPLYREAVQDVAPPRDQENRPGPRMLPVQNRQGENAENGVRAAVAPTTANGAVNQGNEPERMPRGVAVPASDREKLQHSIDALHRKYQEDLKSLLSPPAAPQQLEDQVSQPGNRQEAPGGSGRGNQVDSSEPALTQRDGSGSRKEPSRRRSAEEFFDLIQASNQVVPPWAKGDPAQKGASKDGVAQTRFDPSGTPERAKGTGPSANRPMREAPATSETTDRGGR